MGIVLGIDVGGSTTKIIGFRRRELLGTLQVRALDQITSMFGAIGNFLQKYSLPLGGVSSIILTGVGASFFNEKVYGIDTYKADEFLSIGHGGMYLSGLNEAIVASLGTGTAFVRAAEGKIEHIGGSGVGGGTLIGLASRMIGKNDFDAIIDLAKGGSLENVDLLVHEIMARDIPSLPSNLTASNFGKIKPVAEDSDFALGIINMVFQTVGMLAVFAARNDTIKDLVFTGTLTTLPQAESLLTTITSRYDMNCIIPPAAVFATAIGAAIPYLED